MLPTLRLRVRLAGRWAVPLFAMNEWMSGRLRRGPLPVVRFHAHDLVLGACLGHVGRRAGLFAATCLHSSLAICLRHHGVTGQMETATSSSFGRGQGRVPGPSRRVVSIRRGHWMRGRGACRVGAPVKLQKSP